MTLAYVAAPTPAALVWLDARHALVAQARPGAPFLTEIDRALDDEGRYLRRVARAASHCDRVVVFGSDASRLAFEREYVALYRRPDRLIDAGADVEPSPRELMDRLRLITSLAIPAS